MFGSRGGDIVKMAKEALELSNIEGYEVLNTTDALKVKFSKYLSNLDKISAVWDHEAGILFADKCLKAVWVTVSRGLLIRDR